MLRSLVDRCRCQVSFFRESSVSVPSSLSRVASSRHIETDHSNNKKSNAWHGEAIWSVFGFGLARERVCDESESSESESDSFRHYLRVVYEASLSCFPAEPLKVTDCSLSEVNRNFKVLYVWLPPLPWGEIIIYLHLRYRWHPSI